jgi:hypothetical protein
LGSRDPKTGLILKGTKHKTFDKALAADELMGFAFVRDPKTNRVFSVPTNRPEPSEDRIKQLKRIINRKEQ